MTSHQILPDPFYYLSNFTRVLTWISERHAALLSDEEWDFINQFSALPKCSQALLVRMVMRKGSIFSATGLHYAEIGDSVTALEPLFELGWVCRQHPISAAELAAALTKPALSAICTDCSLPQSTAKGLWLNWLESQYPDPRPLVDWVGADFDLHAVMIKPLCERFRLMFFGNLHQDWSEFVLTELGLYRYETVILSDAAWAFRSRDDIDRYLNLQRCREAFEVDGVDAAFLAQLPEPSDNPWLERRRGRLLFDIAYLHERTSDLQQALVLYEQIDHPEARERRIRIHEKRAEWELAFQLAEAALAQPVNEVERQRVSRMLPRLRRGLQHPPLARIPAPPIETMNLTLVQPDEFHSVEYCVQETLATADAPVFYVENTLFNALFGLLCWEAIFAPVSGAFFHPFQSGPADLHDPEFRTRRADIFERCFAAFEDGGYEEIIRRTYRDKCGLLSPFVFWGALDEDLLALALHCIPASHLRAWCEWLLRDIKQNRAGLPDLIQFWPAERRYQLVEVKGPGDRLQDNQHRWLNYCHERGLPVSVCYVQWMESA